ncbi:MAG: 16S rRNA (adenine(1518)-N(6)/adenine(1519)-N(6))-dimethyltransferase RsmA [Acidobacteriota bacterium]
MSSRRRFGQHFLVNRGVVDRIVEAAELSGDDVVLEIGPGKGALTEPLVASGQRVVALEIDRDLVAEFPPALTEAESFTLVEADANRADWRSVLPSLDGARVKLLSNLPYESSSPLIVRYLETSLRDDSFDLAVLMMQLEVAQRLAAEPGSKNHGSLAALARATHSIETVVDVSPGSFRPPPKVQSRVLRLRPLERPLLAADEHAGYAAFLRLAFSQRRKQLAGLLHGNGGLDREGWSAQLRRLGHPPTVRAEALSPEELVALFRQSVLETTS